MRLLLTLAGIVLCAPSYGGSFYAPSAFSRSAAASGIAQSTAALPWHSDLSDAARDDLNATPTAFSSSAWDEFEDDDGELFWQPDGGQVVTARYHLQQDAYSAEPLVILDDPVRPPATRAGEAFPRFWTEIQGDYRHFYGWPNLRLLLGGIGVAAILANADLDDDFARNYQQSARSSATNSFSSVVEKFGRGVYVLPLFAALTLGELCYENRSGQSTCIGEWGTNTFRSVLVGGPMVFVLQPLIGGSRPNEMAGSKWKPFSGNNGVSGHAFLGALPFLNAAMMTDNCWLKTTLIGASTLTAWSRVNDNKHFLSQVLLGWWIAYLSTLSVHETNLEIAGFQVEPAIFENGYGVQATYTW